METAKLLTLKRHSVFRVERLRVNASPKNVMQSFRYASLIPVDASSQLEVVHLHAYTAVRASTHSGRLINLKVER